MTGRGKYDDLILALNGDDESAQVFVRQHTIRRQNFVSFFDNYISSHGIQRGYIIREANINPQYGYKLLNGTKHTHNRNIILRICIVAKMNLENIQEALRCYDMRLLDSDIIRDRIIMAGIESNRDLYGIDVWLRKTGIESLFDDCT